MGSDHKVPAQFHETQVSIHAPAWGATRSPTRRPARPPVSIHAPAWGATSGFDGLNVLDGVSIHAPAWGATHPSPGASPSEKVSIHAPAWGATPRLHPRRTPLRFQFTLPHGERLHRRPRFPELLRFQFTLPHGERPQICQFFGNVINVSIHAPAWGATQSIPPPIPSTWFQFTLPHGERLPSATPKSLIAEFQFTLPHGERQVQEMGYAMCYGFNSRSRMGSDPVVQELPRAGWKFQFTLPHGERLVSLALAVADLAFQFTLPHGERQAYSQPSGFQSRFQFTLPHGERLDEIIFDYTDIGFNSRSRMGSDAALRKGLTRGGRFNSRSRMGSDSGARGMVCRAAVSIHAPAWGAT